MKRRSTSETSAAPPQRADAISALRAPGACGSRTLWLVIFGVLLLGVLAGRMIRWQSTAARDQVRGRALALAKAQKPEAEPVLEEVLASNPRDLEVIKAMVGVQMVADQPGKALDYLARWSELEPGNANPVRLRFEIASRVHRQEVALESGRRLLGMETNRIPVLRKLMWIEVSAGQLDAAWAHADEGLKLLPGDADFRYLQAHVHHLRGETTAAIGILDALLAGPAPPLPAVFLRGTIHREQKEAGKAVPLLRKVVKEEANGRIRQQARYQLAQALYQLGERGEADREMAQWQRFEQARQAMVDAYQQPANRELGIEAGRMLLETGQEAEGIGLLEEMLVRYPDAVEVHRLLAEHYERRGERERAVRHREQIRRGS